MIPRKEAKRLLAEVYDRVAAATHQQHGEPPDLRAVVEETLAESDLVLRGAENVEQKARRYLSEGRLRVERYEKTESGDSALIVASCRGDGQTYRLGYDPRRKEWRCTCVAGSRRAHRCAHLIALRLVVESPSDAPATTR